MYSRLGSVGTKKHPRQDFARFSFSFKAASIEHRVLSLITMFYTFFELLYATQELP